MESYNSNQIKKAYSTFSNNNGFIFCDSEPIVAPSDSKLLFNISGGVLYQDELLGIKDADNKQVSSIQRCLRTDNLKNIGVSGRHHLLFEMLGHFMFYNCKEMECKTSFIKFAYDFLTKEVGLNKNRLYATVHPNDNVSIKVWKQLGNKNLIFSDKNIFTSPYAEKSALRTEILWQMNNNEKTLVELWNLVFTQFNSKEVFQKPSKYIAADSGASLERIVTSYENKDNNYDNSMWNDFVSSIKSLNISMSDEHARRIADFINAIAGLIDEGLIPGSKVQNYMLRKMLRILFDMCDEYNLDLINIIDLFMLYSHLNISYDKFNQILSEEKKNYLLSISNGLKQARKMIIKKGIDSIDPEYFKSTFGLPEKYINQLIVKNNEAKQRKYIRED